MLKFLKRQEKEFGYNFSRLFNNLEDDEQTKKGWHESIAILKKLYDRLNIKQK